MSLDTLFRRGAETWVIKAEAEQGDSSVGQVGSIGGDLSEVGEEKDSYIADLDDDEKTYEGVDRVLREASLSQVTAQSETVMPRLVVGQSE